MSSEGSDQVGGRSAENTYGGGEAGVLKSRQPCMVAGGLSMFHGRFVMGFVHHDQPDIWQRGKKGAAGTDHHL